MRNLAILAVLVSIGCHRSTPSAADAGTPAGPDLCEQMIDHMFTLAEATGKLSFTQRMMMRGFKSQVMEPCRKEGVTQAQANCFLLVNKLEDMQSINECPALKAHPLKWLSSQPSDGGTNEVDEAPAPHAPAKK